MAKNVSLLGANYPDVSAVTLPQTGGGNATFTDVSDTTAGAGDVLSGKTSSLYPDKVRQEDVFFERQSISVSGFNGNMKETTLAFEKLHSGYNCMVANVFASSFDTSHFIYYYAQMTKTNPTTVIEHNLTSNISTVYADIIYYK